MPALPMFATGMAVVAPRRRSGFDLAVAGYRCTNLLYRFDGTAMRDVADLFFADVDAPTLVVAGGDLDGDGEEEVYLLASEVRGGVKAARDLLLDPICGGWRDHFAEVVGQVVRHRFAGNALAALDRLGQGQYGFIVGSFGGPLGCYELDERGQLVDSAPKAGLDEIVSATGLLIGPIAGPRTDLLVANRFGPSLHLAGIGAGGFRVAEEGLLAALPQGVAAFVHGEHPSLPDVALMAREGWHHLLRRGDDGLMDASPRCLADPSAARAVVVGDIDNDGHEEIFVHNHDEPNRLYGWREGNWRLLDCGEALEPASAASSAILADLDGDGVLELVLAHGGEAEQRLSVYRSPEASGRRWLRVLPRTRQGAPARGSLVTVVTRDRHHVRVIDGGSGCGGQSEPAAHIGLGDDDEVVSVTVHFPDGSEATRKRPPSCRSLEITPSPQR